MPSYKIDLTSQPKHPYGVYIKTNMRLFFIFNFKTWRFLDLFATNHEARDFILRDANRRAFATRAAANLPEYIDV